MNLEPDCLELKPNEPGLPEFRIRAKDIQSVEYVRQAWLKDIQHMKEGVGKLNYTSVLLLLLLMSTSSLLIKKMLVNSGLLKAPRNAC